MHAATEDLRCGPFANALSDPGSYSDQRLDPIPSARSLDGITLALPARCMKLPGPQADPDSGRSARKGLRVQNLGGIEMSRLPVQPTPAAPPAASESPTNARPGLVPINPTIAGPESSVPASAPPSGVAAIAPAAPHLQAQPSPAPLAPLRGVLTGPNGEKAVFLSDEEFDSKFLKESHTLHIGIASVCSGLFLIMYAGIGMAGAAARSAGSVSPSSVQFCWACPWRLAPAPPGSWASYSARTSELLAS